MSAPTTFNFALIKVGDGANPENFTTVCGLNTTGFNRTAANRTQSIRDCANPALPPEQKVLVTGVSRELTGSGLYNTAQTALLNTLLGTRKDFEFVIMDATDPTVPGGTVLGNWKGPGVCTALNMGTSENGDATISITIASNGAWTYTDMAA